MFNHKASYHIKSVLVFTLFCITQQHNLVLAQNFANNYTQFDIEDGLPSSETYFAYQDEQGYMWFTTDRGIVRYDGYDFHTYTEADGLAELVNFKIHKDPRGGFITIGKEGKITTYRDGEFRPFEHNDSLTGISYDTIIATYHLEISSLSDSLILLKPIFLAAHRTITHYHVINRYSGQLYALNIKDINTLNISNHNNKLHQIHLRYDNIYRIIEQSLKDRSNYFLVKRHELPSYLLLFTGNRLVKKVEVPYKFNQIYVDSKKRIWLSTQSELYYTNDSVTSSNLMNFELPNNLEISSIFEDRDKNIWVMTINGGLLKISISNWIKQFPLSKINNRVIKLYSNPPYLKMYSRLNKSKHFGLLRDSVFCLVKSNEYYLFQNDSLKRVPNLDRDTFLKPLYKQYRQFKHVPSQYPILNVHSSDSIIIIEIFNHLYLRFKWEEHFDVLQSPYVYDFKLVDSSILIATSKGLFRYHFRPHDKTLDKSNKLIEGRINELASYNPKCFWVATLNDGLYYYTIDNISKIINPFHEINSINAIEVTSDSIVYIGTSRGLYRLKYKKIEDSIIVTNSYWFGKTEGLSSSYISGIEKYQNNVYIGTLNGLYYFNEDDFKINSSIPKIYINNIKLIDDNTLFKPEELTEFESYENNLQINYTGLYLLKESKIDYYRYNLSQNTEDLNWIYTNNRSVLLNDLSPGDYTFSVQCRNNNNEWSKSASVQFSISPHFTQTWTFRVSAIVLLGFGIWAYFRGRNKRIKRDQEIQKEMINVKMQSTRNQMNPHFVFNGMNAIQNFIFKEDKRSANRYISKFSSLIRDSLKMSHMDSISLEKEIDFIERYLKLEKQRFPDKFEYSIKVDSSISEKDVFIPPLMVQTLAENAVKHAFKGVDRKGIIIISYEYEHNTDLLYIKVADNGIGIKNMSENKVFEEKEEFNKFGLRLLQRRINIINQKHEPHRKARFFINYFNKSNQTGTLITIIMPLNGKNN